MNNAYISDQLSMLSKLMELHGQNSFRAKSYSIAAFQIDKSDKDFATLSKTEIIAQKGIGESVGNKIWDLLQSGSLPALEQLVAQTPDGVLDLLQVKGIGPKKVAQLWTQLGIENLAELELAAVENRLKDVSGFGEKTQAKILESIAFMRQHEGFALYVRAKAMWEYWQNLLLKEFTKEHFYLTGAMRRQEDTISQIEVLTLLEKNELLSFLESLSEVELEQDNDTVILRNTASLPVKFHFSTAEDFAKSWMKTTGDETFLAHFTSIDEIIEAKEESEIFAVHKVSYIPPYLRTGTTWINAAQQHALPEVIQVADVKGLIHCHSTWSDGAATIEEMALACMKLGLEYMVLSDHSQAAFYARGLTAERVIEQHEEIDLLNKKLAPFKIFKSIESDILNDGSLDYEEEVLESFDLVIASVHSNLGMTEEKAMERLLTAIAHPATKILGHPTGRLLLSRAGYPIDHKKIIDACVANEVVIEINANPRRLDLDWSFIPYAISKGAMLSINPDAHSTTGIEDIQYGVLSAQKGGLTKDRNLSSKSLAAFETFLKEGL